MSDLFPENPTLPLLQDYILRKCRQRGFDSAKDLEIFLLFAEEVGEMAKAIRKRRKLFQENKNGQKSPNQDNLAEEMADVLSYLLDLANRFDVDLEEAFRQKESVNEKRSWQSKPSNLS